MQKQTVQLQHTKRRAKVFMRTSVGLAFLCEMTANHFCYPPGTPREVKHQKQHFLKSSRTDTVLKGVIRRGLATLFAVSLNVQTGASNINVFTVQACVCCNRGRTSPIYLHVVMFSSLLFVPALFNVALVPPPVLADPTGSQVCRRAMLAAPSLRGWIRCVCHGERWFGVGSTEAR